MRVPECPRSLASPSPSARTLPSELARWDNGDKCEIFSSLGVSKIDCSEEEEKV